MHFPMSVLPVPGGPNKRIHLGGLLNPVKTPFLLIVSHILLKLKENTKVENKR